MLRYVKGMNLLLRSLVTFCLAFPLAGAVNAVAASGSALFKDGFELPTRATGGSNYLWFGDDGQCQQNSRDAYGILKRYHEVDAVDGPVRAIVQQQLAAMHQRGMRRLSLGVYFMHQPAAGGTLIDSSDPAEVAQATANLANLLSDVKNAGYHEVLFRFFATNNINPSQPEFPRHDDSTFGPRVDEYWNFVQALRPALASSGLAYRIDLMVEGAPSDSNNTLYPVSERYKYPTNQTWSRAVRTLWQRYFAAYGAGDTVGFSFLIDDDNNKLRSRVRHMRYVYEGNYPHLFAMDFYAGAQIDEYQKFMRMHTHMTEQNPGGAHWDKNGWIIAEAFYEDPLAAEGLARAIRQTGRTVFYLTQWPQDRAGACEIPHVNTPPPYEWLVWPMLGF